MIAVILAAGMAKRLRPLTDQQPKCLLEIGGRSLLQRSVDALSSTGIHDFVIVTGYLHRQIEVFLQDHYPDDSFTFIQNDDYVTTNNIYSLWLARPWVDGKDFLLLDSDLLYDPAILKRLLRQEGNALTVCRHPLGKEEMKVVVDNDTNIVEISKTCDPIQAYGESVGIEKFTPAYSQALYSLLATMIEQEKQVDIFYEAAFQRLIPQGYRFKVIDTTDLFSIELDTPEDFYHAQKLIPKELY